ncbi:hypothetical protein MKX01_011937 [Papaver californicum]|nr:hypothetical protein MKX01_011937 [Papaver californicum]
MKRGYESASTSIAPPQSRQRIDPNGVSQYREEDENTKNLARRVADYYSARSNQTLEEREASPIIHLKKLNNWIKSVLIQLYARRGDVVLDLACGKVGDLIKWDKARVEYYVGIDIAEGSIEDCRTRYNGDADHHQRRNRLTFPARLLCGDCFEVRFDEVLRDDGPFDICSCQRFKSSNPFGIKYKFHLEDAVDCPECIVPFPVFKSLAEENSHGFVDQYLKRPEFAELMRRLGALGDGNQDTSTLSLDEWEVAYLYSAFVLKKQGEPDPNRKRANRTNNGPTQISKDDIMYISNEE